MGCMELSSISCAEIAVSYKLKTCLSGNFGRCLKEDKPPVVYDGEQGIVLEPMQGIGPNLDLIWATPRYVTFLR